MGRARIAIIVTSPPGQATCGELARLAAAGERPRKDYVELAQRIEADVIDRHWMRERASPLARYVASHVAMPAGQVIEAFLRRRRYDHIVAWGDRFGLPLALLFKLARSDRDLVMISVWLSRPKKAFFLRWLGVHSHLRAIITRQEQAEIAVNDLGVPRSKVHVEARPVDDGFWHPLEGVDRPLLCATGWEARDYATLLEAVRDVDAEIQVAVGSVALPEMEGRGGSVERAIGRVGAGRPPNVHVAERRPHELRQLYAEARAVVVPLHDVSFDAGVTAVTEAMAMGKPVIVSQTRGLGALIENGQQGLLVPPGDAPALRAAIQRLLDFPEEAARMGRAGRELVEQRHRLDPGIGRLAEIICADSAIDEALVLVPIAPQ